MRDRTASDPDYRLTAADVTAWERRHGRIAPGTIVLLHTGWGALCPDCRRLLENLANLDQLPPRGALVVALPMKIEGGSGGPLRAIALLPR